MENQRADSAPRNSQQPMMASNPNAPADREHFVLGLFYHNPDDPRGIVPRNNGYGSTINFANHKQSRLVIFSLLAVIIPVLLALIVIALLHH
ncbi:DUF5808 domain-containing protein [Dictyobacter kobayashii]|uniref:DUF5808 domain-containing protein n=1 Tax=Dictyobacter kobayashii TaxID=2014872 RepID=A0A402AQA5_9CHLR|nr:DUF5808 domain-containing protein [Dictyobacter kobayashii]GCE21272.1 hypothetical protein KDK_50720 [Dictyobacter kobayashii]